MGGGSASLAAPLPGHARWTGSGRRWATASRRARAGLRQPPLARRLLGGRGHESPGGGVGFDRRLLRRSRPRRRRRAPCPTPGGSSSLALEPPVPELPRAGWSFRAPRGSPPPRAGTHRVHADPGGPGPADRRRPRGRSTGSPTRRRPATAFYGMGSVEVEAPVELEAGAAGRRGGRVHDPGRRGRAASRSGCRAPEPPDLTRPGRRRRGRGRRRRRRRGHDRRVGVRGPRPDVDGPARRARTSWCAGSSTPTRRPSWWSTPGRR